MALESYTTETTDSSTEWILSMKFWKRKKIRHVDFDQREKKTEIEIYFITAETAVILLRDWRH